MESRDCIRSAVTFFANGYNCAQSVLMGFAQPLGLTTESAEGLAAGFGAGVGGMRGNCGAFSALVMAYGLIRGYDSRDPRDKADFYREIRALAERFGTDCGALDCKTLLENAAVAVRADPVPRTPEYYKERPCAAYVRAASEILAELLEARAQS